MLIVQNAAKPAGIRNAIVDLVALGLIDIRVASAYVTLSGCNILLGAVRDAVGTAQFAAMPKMLVTSFDFGLTEPQALRHWLGPVDKPRPDADASEQDESHEAGGELVIPGGDAPLLLEMANEALNP